LRSSGTREALRSHPVDESGRICLIRQFRHVANDWLWEVPAGKLDGRPPLDTARLELAEEAGLVAGTFESLGHMWASPASLRKWFTYFWRPICSQCPRNPNTTRFSRCTGFH
jgi:8-oxo-dGTP pyrophosphatase MutT (NUDIX family)